MENATAFHVAHTQLREDAGLDYELVRSSALSRVVDLAAFFNRVKTETGKKLNPKDLAAQFKSVTFADRSEKVTETICDQAMRVYERLVLRAPSVFALLLKFDSDMGIDNPLDSIGKLVTICAKAAIAQSQTVKFN